MKKISTAYITRTGLLLALALIFQIGFRGFAQPAVGPLVNLTLILSAGIVGTLAGVIVGCLTPLIALSFGIIGIPILVPFIMIGNSLLVIIFNLIRKRITLGGEYVGLALAALGKFLFLAFSVRYLLDLFTQKNIPPKIMAKLTVMFGLPQLYTALVGGIVAVIVMKLIPDSLKLKN
ncbi:MAG: ECF transporter S component [Firmicutes bacterium]|nr:ECF transporter S component [Bacillota bacterium]